VRLDDYSNRAHIQGPPPTAALPVVITRATPGAVRAPLPFALADTYVHDHPQLGVAGVLVGELDTLNDGLLDSEQPLP
jgi:hypothetical protein